MDKGSDYQLSERFKKILAVLHNLGKIATTRQIAEKTGLTVAGTSRSLKVLASHQYIKHLEGQKGLARWKLIKST